jgi:positive regulator of sigma E activity
LIIPVQVAVDPGNEVDIQIATIQTGVQADPLAYLNPPIIMVLQVVHPQPGAVVAAAVAEAVLLPGHSHVVVVAIKEFLTSR